MGKQFVSIKMNTFVILFILNHNFYVFYVEDSKYVTYYSLLRNMNHVSCSSGTITRTVSFPDALMHNMMHNKMNDKMSIHRWLPLQ